MRLGCRLGLHTWIEKSQEPRGNREREEYDDGYFRGWVDYQVVAVTRECGVCGATRVRTERRQVDSYADEYNRGDNR